VVSPVARFTRPGLTEEYSVSVDGVRQDFIVAQPPEGAGQLRVALEVSGASVQSQADGARLVLAGSGRKIAYSRLRVTDATGRALPARMEAAAEEEVGGGLPARRRAGLAVLVDDADAVYPVRIDPTFSDANWVSLGGIPGADYGIETAAVDASGNLYIGGMFSVVGDVLANCVAKWDGSSWSALGQGVTGEDFHMVYALAVLGSDLYVGGVFTNAGGVAANSIAKWNGSSWSALGTGVSGGSYGDSYVYALAVSGTSLFVGGDFTSAGNYPSPANNIAVWTGTSWTIAGTGLNGPVYALAASASFLYVGGQFTAAADNPAYNVARFASGHWSALGSGLGLNSRVWAMAVSGSDLYVGGDFTYATNAGPTAVSATRVAKWNGSSWSALGSGTSGSVRALAVSGSDLYAGGSFSRAGGNWVMAVAKWDGSAWSALGSGVDSGVSALVVSGGNLYAVGGFRTAGGRAALGGAKWDGSDWSALASGFNSAVLALAVSGSDLYVGGGFISTGGGEAYYVAKWSGGNWTPLAGGLNGYVTALALMGGNLYVGGDFTYATNAGASAVSVNNIAKWDGSSWSALGAGLLGHSSSPVVNALAVSGDVLYAGGSITNAGGSAATCVAKWNGTAWSPIGFFKIVSTESPVVYALAVSGSDLYVGGNFTGPWELGTYDVSKYNGSVWSKLGSGVSGNGVYALAVSGSDLYVGGDFQNASGTAASRVAKWNGTSWSALGSGLNNAAQAFAFLGSDIYVGGWFTTAGGNPAKYMARWDGSSWSAVGSGADDSVKALALAGTDLYAGGYFDVAGGKVCGSVAKLQRNPLVWTSGNATWDTATAAWQDYAGASTAYLNGDHVRFTDAASGTAPQITLNATVTPASVTNDSTKNFTVSGSGKISGGAWLAKAGSGTLTLGTANDYTGATTITGGKLLLTGSLAAGSAVSVAAGAALGGTGTAAGSVTVNGTIAPRRERGHDEHRFTNVGARRHLRLGDGGCYWHQRHGLGLAEPHRRPHHHRYQPAAERPDEAIHHRYLRDRREFRQHQVQLLGHRHRQWRSEPV
jgi:autotransporter-associated beta strand protein